MRILMTPDILEWAIGSLSKAIIKHNPRFNWSLIPVHPRGVANSLPAIVEALKKGVDFWHAQYWNSAIQMLNVFPELKHKPSLLTHHNHHCLEKKDWRVFSGVNEMTNWGCDVLRKKHNKVYHIPHGIDLDRYSFIDDYPSKNDIPTVGYVGRVVPWKKLDKICEAAKNLDYKVVGYGYIDKPDYWNRIKELYVQESDWDRSILDFTGQVGRHGMAPANMKDDGYKKMDVFVAYSVGEKESGTLPLLEAMARGVPVMATAQGMARDLIEHNKNGVIFNEDNFESELKRVMEDVELRKQLRKNAWETIKNYPEQKMARAYAKSYYDIIWSGNPVVSVIIPTFERAEHLVNTITSIETQEYLAKEIIVVDDGSQDKGATELLCRKLKEKIRTPLLYLNTNHKGYGLAKARNMGVVEALGDILLFLDDRLTLEDNALAEIAKVPDKKWHHGAKLSKGKISTKRTFIENFSWIKKSDFVSGGMFNERMGYYGGMSQLLREQYSEKVEFKYNNKATAYEAVRARRGRKTDIWKAKEIIAKLNA